MTVGPSRSAGVAALDKFTPRIHMNRFALDGPIKFKTEDKLNRAHHVESIVDLLLDSGPAGFVVSLEGSWGTGKTSLINLVTRGLSESKDGGPVVVHFSPWMVGDSGTLVREFLKQIALGIGMPRTASIMSKSAKLFNVGGKLLTYLRYAPGVGPFRDDLKEAAEALKVSQDLIESSGEAVTATQLDVNKRKEEVVEALNDLESPVVVVLDDVDRLAPKDVYEVIRLVRAVGDFPRLRYVLAMDPDYVESALEKSGVFQPANFLDKIFHHRFVIPPVPQEELRDLLVERIETLRSMHPAGSTWLQHKERLSDLMKQGLSELLTTLRDVKVIANRAQLQAGLLAEINLGDVIAFEALAIKAPSVYRHILRNPDAYTGFIGQPSLDRCLLSRREKGKAALERVLGEVDVEIHDSIERLVDALFPSDSATYYGDDECDLARGTEVAKGRLSAPSRLRIAVLSRTSNTDLPLRHVYTFLSEPSRRSEIVADICRLNALARFGWLLAGARSMNELKDPDNALEHFGHLLDLPNSQLVLDRDRIASRVTKRLFQDMRKAAKAGGTPLLSERRYGITLPYLEMELWRQDTKEAAGAVQISPTGEVQNANTYFAALGDQLRDLEEQSGQIWLAYIEPLLASGDLALRKDFYKLCQLREMLSAGCNPTDERPNSRRSDILNSVRSDFDRFGRKFYTSRGHDAAQHQGLDLVALREDATLFDDERAAVMALEMVGANVRANDSGLVEASDFVPKHDDSFSVYVPRAY
jgi:hypothetical protein